MAYVDPDFKTKKAFKAAVEAGEPVEIYQPGGIGYIPVNGSISVEGPHYPKPHTWYARVKLAAGRIVEVK